jgi:class 3 adenylate cyclase
MWVKDAATIPMNPTAPSGERRQVTALFADMVGFTAISERLGEENTYVLIRMVFEAMAGAVREHGGSVQDFTGDGILALFGVPDALENAPLLACRAGLLIHERLAAIAPAIEAKHGVRPRMRIAINTGPVVVTNIRGHGAAPTALGDMVNVASRLQALAEPGAVLLSQATHELVQGFVEATFAGSHEIKGKAEPQKVWRLDSIREGATRFEVALRQGLTAYVGRERELDILLRGLASSRSHLRVIDVVGEPGIGKSRLLYEFRQRAADAHVTILSGNCSGDGRHIPFLPFIEVVRDSFRVKVGEAENAIVQKLKTGLNALGLDTPQNLGLLLNLLGLAPPPGALAGLDGVLIGLRTRDLLLRILEALCRRAPVALLVEDLHWVDSVSQEMLGQIVENAAKLNLLVVHTRRPDYEPPWRSLPEVDRLALEPLPEADVRHLIQLRLGVDALPEALALHVAERAEGNALFAEEILSFLTQRGALRADRRSVEFDAGAVAAALPASLQGLLSARVDRLAPRDRTLLQTAAAIGRQFDPTLLAAVADEGSGVEARLATMTALDLVYPEVNSSDYAFKHALVRDTVYQSLLSGSRSALHLRIAEAMERRGSNRLAEVAETLAYHYSNTDRADKAFTYLAWAGLKSLGVYSLDEADQYFAAAVALVNKEPACASDAQLADMLANYALCSNISLKLKQIIDLATHFQPRLERLGDSQQRALIRYHYVQTLLWSSKFKQAEQAQRELAAMTDRLGDARSCAYALVTDILISTHVAPKPVEVIRADARKALAAAESAGDAYLQYNVLAAAAWDELNRGLITEASRAAEEMLGAGLRANDPRSMGYALALKALIALMRDDYIATLQFAEEAIGISRVPFDRETANSARNAALVLLRRKEAMDSVRAFMDTCTRNGWHLLRSGPDDLWGVALILSGEVGGGVRYMKEAIVRRENEGYRGSADWTRMFLCEIYLQLLSGGGKASAHVLMKNFLTLAKIKLTAPRQIVALIEKVRTNPQFDPNGIFVARCEMILGQLCKVRKQRARAIEHLTEARRITSQFGASPILARIEVALSELAA